MSAITGSTADATHGTWARTVGRLTRDVVGLGGIFILTPDAQEEFDVGMTRPFTVPPGALRTYLPDTDPAMPEAAPRHRVLSSARIAAEPHGRLAKMLGYRAREMALSITLPHHLERADLVLSRMITSARMLTPTPALRPAARSTPTVDAVSVPAVEIAPDLSLDSVIVEELIAEVEAVVEEVPATEIVELEPDVTATRGMLAKVSSIVRSLFGREAVDDVALEELERHAAVGILAEQQEEVLLGRIEQERQRSRLFLNDLEDELLDHAETAERLFATESQLRALHVQLAADGRVEMIVAAQSSEAEFRPSDFSELLARLATLHGPAQVEPHLLPHVVFTGSRDAVNDLADADTMDMAVGKAWDALLAIEDYARLTEEERFTGNLHMYCLKTPPQCHGWSANRHATAESEDVENRSALRRLRVLPVPTTVDPSGCVYMEAHFKLTQNRSVSPRMPYHDDTAHSGKVFVGYIGRHLDTSEGA